MVSFHALLETHFKNAGFERLFFGNQNNTDIKAKFLYKNHLSLKRFPVIHIKKHTLNPVIVRSYLIYKCINIGTKCQFHCFLSSKNFSRKFFRRDRSPSEMTSEGDPGMIRSYLKGYQNTCATLTCDPKGISVNPASLKN